MKRTFANVPHHNGFEAWRRIYEPVNEDKALRRKDLLLKVTNPRAASGINDLAKALEDWETSKREFEEADGARQTDDSERLVFLDLIPQEISAHVIMHMDMPGYETYDAIRKYALKMVKVLQNQKRKPGGINTVTERMGMQPGCGTDFGEQEVEEEEVEFPSMAEICAFMANDPPAAEVNAFMKGRFVRKGPAGGSRGAGGRFQPGNGGGFKPGGAGAGARPPPRGASDMSCVNCGIKGHMAAECRKPKADRKDQPCFTCGKTGHQSRMCPMKGQVPIKTVEDAKNARDPVFCGCVSLADEHGFKTVLKGPRPQQQGAVVADFLRTPTSTRAANSNRYRALTVADIADASVVREITCRGGGHPLLMRQVEPKHVATLPVCAVSEFSFPELRPSGQGENVEVPARAEKQVPISSSFASTLSSNSSSSTPTPHASHPADLPVSGGDIGAAYIHIHNPRHQDVHIGGGCIDQGFLRIYIAGKIVVVSGYQTGVGRRRTSCWEINCCMNIVRG